MKTPTSFKNLVGDYAAQQKLHKPDNDPLRLTCIKLVAAQSKDFVPTVTIINQKQLKVFAAKCPEGKAVEVMNYAVNNWTWFASQVKSEVAPPVGVPSSPYIGFLLAHANIAVKLALAPKAVKTAPPAKSVDMPMQMTASMPKPNMPTSIADIMSDPDEDL